MVSKGKVWVIEADPRPRRKKPPAPKGRPAVSDPSDHTPPPTAPKTLSGRSHTRDTQDATHPTRRIAATYVLGNLEPYLLQRGERSPVWAGIGVGALLVWAVHLGQWPALAGWLASGKLLFPVWLLLLVVVSLLGLLAGARALFHAGREMHFVVSRLPLALRHPKIIGLMGFAVPGSGLLCTGHPWKAAWAYMNAGITALALLTLLHWNELWAIHQQSGGAGLAPTTLERIFVVCLAVFLSGLFACVYNAFDGARHASRMQDRVNTLGPWWVVPAFAVQLFLLASFDAGARARDLDRLAAELAQQGYTYVPYHIERLALRLDPSNVEYLVHAARLADTLGHGDQGTALRQQAETNWERATQLIDVMQPHPLAASPATNAVVEDTRPPLPEAAPGGPGVPAAPLLPTPASGAHAASTEEPVVVVLEGTDVAGAASGVQNPARVDSAAATATADSVAVMR